MLVGGLLGTYLLIGIIYAIVTYSAQPGIGQVVQSGLLWPYYLFLTVSSGNLASAGSN